LITVLEGGSVTGTPITSAELRPANADVWALDENLVPPFADPSLTFPRSPICNDDRPAGTLGSRDAYVNRPAGGSPRGVSGGYLFPVGDCSNPGLPNGVGKDEPEHT